jgi:hypothetical protein
MEIAMRGVKGVGGRDEGWRGSDDVHNGQRRSATVSDGRNESVWKRLDGKQVAKSSISNANM